MFKDITLSDIYNKEKPFETLMPGTGIVFIGKAQIGPAMTPVKATSIDEVIATFGIDSQLTRAYDECNRAGGLDIYLLRINGSHATLSVQDAILLTSTNATTESNSLQYSIVTDGSNRFLNLYNAQTDYYASYCFNNKTIEQLTAEINTNAMTFQSPVYAEALVVDSASILVDESLDQNIAQNGDSQLHESFFFTRLEQALSYLSAYPIGQIGVLCSQFREIDIDRQDLIYQLLSEFVTEKVRMCEPCIVTIGSDESITDFGLAKRIAETFTQNISTECQVSEFINIVIGKLVYRTLGSEYTSFGVPAYCGLISKLHFAEGTTNKQIFGPVDDIIQLSKEDKLTLADLGYVMFTSSTFNGEKQVRVLKGVNMVRSTSHVVNFDYDIYTPESDGNLRYLRKIPSLMSSMSNVKLVQYVAYQLRDLVNEEDDSKISSLKSRIDSIMSNLGAYINDYDLLIEESEQGFTRNYTISLSITPVGEVSSALISIKSQ